MELQFTFYTIALAVVKTFVLMGVGYLLYRTKVIDGKFTDTLSIILVRVIFPALIVSKMITYFSFSGYPGLWVLPLFAIAFSLIGMALGLIAFPFLKGFSPKKEFVASSGFQNCGYLPMTLLLFAFQGAIEEKLLIYLFFFIIGFNILMWSIVPLVLSGDIKKGFSAKVMLNPPVLATVFSLFWVAVAGKGSMPSILMDPITRLGQAAFPIAMITLGAYLSMHQAHKPERIMPLVTCGVIKLVLLPVIVFSALFFLPLNGDMKFFLFLESIMPTAVSLVVIGSYTGADNRFFSSVIFYTHVVAIFSIPLWLALFHAVMK
ncbi:MAG: AEC family transporter [Candidatus Tantalella remota]|nr:AEC family transporter [Candidatus Tantalella remota]